MKKKGKPQPEKDLHETNDQPPPKTKKQVCIHILRNMIVLIAAIIFEFKLNPGNALMETAITTLSYCWEKCHDRQDAEEQIKPKLVEAPPPPAAMKPKEAKKTRNRLTEEDKKIAEFLLQDMLISAKDFHTRARPTLAKCVEYLNMKGMTKVTIHHFKKKGSLRGIYDYLCENYFDWKKTYRDNASIREDEASLSDNDDFEDEDESRSRR